jgi:ribosome-binding ATPase YchF (GTP1/OBG family)
LKDEERQRKERIKKLTKIIHDYEHKIAHPPEVEDIEIVNNELVSAPVYTLHAALVKTSHRGKTSRKDTA